MVCCSSRLQMRRKVASRTRCRIVEVVHRRRAKGGGFASRITLIVLAFLVGLCSATSMFPLTPDGVQCPTAPIQTIAVPVSCCGKVIGYQQRAPKPGEPGFVQCRCAEKRSPMRHSATVPKVQVFLPVESEVINVGHRFDPLPATGSTLSLAGPDGARGVFHPPHFA